MPKPVLGGSDGGARGDGPGEGSGSSNGGPRGGPALVVQNQPFTRTDPLPLYVSDGARHPLPPVLPLDQSLPVAGFSEAAGDSLALIYLIYRDTTEPDPLMLVTAHGNATPAAPPKVAARPEETTPAIATAADAGPAAAPASEPADTAAGYIAVAVAVPAVAWLSRGYLGALARTIFRLFRIPHRQPTKGST